MQQQQVLYQAQQLKMNAQMLQSIKLMELPIMDLRLRIEEELERNPALEVIEEPPLVSLDAAEENKTTEEEAYFEASSDPGFLRDHKSGNKEFLEGAIARSETLKEHLLWQLAMETGDNEVRQIGELLIQNLDDDGFHKEPVEILLKDQNPAKIQQALRLVQSLDPAGTCTANYHESLKVQARLLLNPPPQMEAALDYLQDLEKGKFSPAARALGCDLDTLKAVYRRIKEDLFPFPGRRFSIREIKYAVPDVEVRRKDGDFVIFLNNEEIPVLGINPFFTELADKKTNTKETRSFARENIKEARWFINSINQRNHTLLRVMRSIVEFQRPFFEKGPRHLSPLKLRDIARELDIHEATVSRTANGKYVQTEWGLYEIRYFFTHSATQGSKASKEQVKELLKELISGDKKRLSDQELADLLASRGIPLARRTVAKYRGELELGSSYAR